MKFQLTPMNQVDAIDNGTQDIMTTMHRAMSGAVAAFVPFITVDPFFGFSQTRNSPENYEIRAKTAMLAQFSSPPSMSMTSEVMWTNTMQVTESI